MKEKVCIFGDSFSDPTYMENNTYSWPTELAKIYDVNNFSIRGTGPEWSLDRLLEQIELAGVDKIKDVNLIFLISNPLRFDFKFYQHPRDQVAFEYLSGQIKSKVGDGLILPYLNHGKFIKNFSKYYLGERIDLHVGKEMIKYVGALKLAAKLFKKTLAWTIFHKITIDNCSSENFTLVDELPLLQIEPGFPCAFGSDTRANHLSEDNHVVMLEQLSNWIKHAIPIDVAKFRIIPVKS